MEIRYKCNRCKKIVRAVLYKTNFKNGKSDKDHKRIDCLECGKYIKFISVRELDVLVNGWREKVEHIPTPIKVKKKSRINLQDINFKLDLILDHLGIEE